MKFLRQNKKLCVFVSAFLLLIFLFYRGMNLISAQTAAEQKRSLEEALHRNIVPKTAYR